MWRHLWTFPCRNPGFTSKNSNLDKQYEKKCRFFLCLESLFLLLAPHLKIPSRLVCQIHRGTAAYEDMRTFPYHILRNEEFSSFQEKFHFWKQNKIWMSSKASPSLSCFPEFYRKPLGSFLRPSLNLPWCFPDPSHKLPAVKPFTFPRPIIDLWVSTKSRIQNGKVMFR